MSVLLDQPRDALGQFASRACPATQRLMEELADCWTDPTQPNRTVLRVDRCQHGHFARWAANNCCKTRGAHRAR